MSSIPPLFLVLFCLFKICPYCLAYWRKITSTGSEKNVALNVYSKMILFIMFNDIWADCECPLSPLWLETHEKSIKQDNLFCNLLLHKAVLALFMEIKSSPYFDSLQKSLAVTGRKMNWMRKWVLHVGTWSRNLARKQKQGPAWMLCVWNPRLAFGRRPLNSKWFYLESSWP